MFRSRLLGCLVVVAALAGCETRSRIAAPASPKSPAPLVVTEVPEERLGSAVVQVLQSGEPGAARTSLLAGVVRRQLRRADTLIRRGEREAGMNAIRGAIWLVRAGEERREMWQGAAPALAEAAEEAARVGDEGKTRALYALVKQAGPTAAMQAAVDEHLAAMDRFAQAAQADPALEVAGDQQRVAVQRSIYEPSTVNLQGAAERLSEWMNKSLQSDVLERWGESSFDREEAIEAFRARRFGALTLVGVFLRHGSPMGALDWLERNDLIRLLPSDMRDRLEQAGEDDDPGAWQRLYQFFQNEADPARADSSVGIELAQSASFGVAVELFRGHPTQMISVGPLALMLPDLMLGDAVPPLLNAALPGALRRDDASWAMALIMRAMMLHGSAGDIDVARRLFAASQPLVERAISASSGGEALRPHPARLFTLMASLESRHADLERARVALQRAIQLDPSANLELELARIERQRQNPDGAHRAIFEALTLARKAADLLTETEAQILLYELESERGNVAPANAALREALRLALSARDRARQPEEQAQAERRFARVLELYGEHEGAKRASMRALDASRANHQQSTATVLDAARRALTYGDLRGARMALKNALELGISSSDCVYVALWTRLVERQNRVPSDGTVEDALARVGEIPPWPGRLKAWVLGQVSDAELQATARTEAEKTEVTFYLAMLGRQGRSSEAARNSLAQVARSHAVGLVEVT
ncbi:MAG TPA: hypothetical protein VKP30_05655, partial [Polyangiaceae bacterium]|nr:hypothetical protein [Polyangiaceae bacterium]